MCYRPGAKQTKERNRSANGYSEREEKRERMGSREKDQDTPHQPLLSSLVVRPTDSGGAGGGAGGSDYEPGEVRRDPPPYSRSDRLHDNNGSSLLIYLP